MSEDLRGGVDSVRDSLEDAQLLVAHGRFKGAANRAYDAFFDLAKGLLLDKNVFVKTRSGVLGKFAELYSQSGQVPVQFSQWLVELNAIQADSDFNAEVTEEMAQESITKAATFLSFVEANFA